MDVLRPPSSSWGVVSAVVETSFLFCSSSGVDCSEIRFSFFDSGRPLFAAAAVVVVVVVVGIVFGPFQPKKQEKG